MPNKHIISKYLGKVKIDEIFQHQNNDSTKGPDGINIRGNMYIDDNLGIGTEFVKNSKLNIVGNISVSESALNNGNILDITNISNNTIFSIQNNKIGIGTKNPLTTLHIVGSDGIIIPYGNTTNDRPAADNEHKGMIRFNTQLNSFEGCDGSNWNSLGGVIDVDQNTYISAENSASNDNNQLKFVTENVQRMIIGNTNQSGNIGIGINNPLSTLHIGGSDGIIIPYGNTVDDRPAANSNHKGMIRFNTQLNSFEGCDGSNWGSLGGVIDVDQNTYISAENSASEDNNQLKFVTENVQRMIIGNTNQSGNIGIGINNPLSTLHISGSDGIIIPYGNTVDDRPEAKIEHIGMIRFNTQLNSFEGCDGYNWGSLGGVIDVDQNTYISAENSASEDNNQLKFVTEGVERMIIGNTSQSGYIGIGTNNPLSTLHVNGNINCDYLYGDVIGTVSSIDNHDTNDLTEGTTNLYYTDQRSRASISVVDQTGTNTVVYNNTTGVITYSDPLSILDRLTSIENKLTSLNEERIVNIETDMVSTTNMINTLIDETSITSVPNVLNSNTQNDRITNAETLLIEKTNVLYTLVGLDTITTIPEVISSDLPTSKITNLEKHIVTINNIFKSLTE